MSKAEVSHLNNDDGNKETAIEMRTKNNGTTGAAESAHYAEPGFNNEFSNSDKIPSQDGDSLMFVCTSLGVSQLYRQDGDDSVTVSWTGASNGSKEFDSSDPSVQVNVEQGGEISLSEVG